MRFRTLLVMYFCIVGASVGGAAPPAESDAKDSLDLQVFQQAVNYERAGKWREAAECWRQWSPFECCPGPAISERTYRIACCLMNSGETKAVAAHCLEVVFNINNPANPRVSLLLLKLYEESHQVRDLARMVVSYERQIINAHRQHPIYKNQPPSSWMSGLSTESIREGLRVKNLKVQRDMKTLIAMAQYSSWHAYEMTSEHEWAKGQQWRSLLAANALAELGDAAVEPLRSELVGPTQTGNPIWLIYALGKSKAPNALVALEEVAKKQSCATLSFAIAQHGDDGRALLEKIAHSPAYARYPCRRSVQAYLTDPKPYPTSWMEIKVPEIKQGSLPQTYPGMVQ